MSYLVIVHILYVIWKTESSYFEENIVERGEITQRDKIFSFSPIGLKVF